MSRIKNKHTFEIMGQDFTTEPIHPDETDPVRVIWDQGESWPLRLLAEGQCSLKLPGEDSWLELADIRSMDKRNRVVIVTGSWTSGLSSFHNWLVGGSNMISLDLDWVSRSEESQPGQIQRAAERIRKQIELLFSPEDRSADRSSIRALWAAIQGNNDPIDLLETIARDHHGLVNGFIFRNFDALDSVTKKALFGRLRRLYDDEDRPMCFLPVFLLGHSYRALDPMMTEPGSNLLPFARLYALPRRTQDEIQAMAKKLDSWEKRLSGDFFGHLMKWSGGHPFLVQALFSLMQSNGSEFSLTQAIADLERERVPAFEIWIRKLTELLNLDAEIERIVHILLREERLPKRLVRSRFAVEELFIQGWIKIKDENIHWFSDCHQMLAGEAYALRKRQ